MGGGTKEASLLDAIRNGDTTNAIKILNKNSSLIKNKSAQQQLPADGSSTLGKNATISKNYQTLKTKLNVNFQNDFGLTCLHQACISGTLDIVRLLIECGAQIDVKDKNGNRALHFACQYGKLDIVCFLLQSGADANDVNNHNSDTPLHVAIQHALTPLAANSLPNASEKIVSQLLNHGARTSLTIKNRTKQTPFELACELGKTKLVELILKWSLMNNMIDQIRENSPNSLHLASKNGHDDILRLLLIFNVVDVNYTSKEGTALHEACRYGRYHTAKLLLESGLNTQTKNSLDQMAIDVVIKQKVGNDLKCLIKEFSQSFVAIATQPYLTNHAGALNFTPNESITVLEKQNQNWRGFILDKSTYTTRSGYFPSAYVRPLLEEGQQLNTLSPNLISQMPVCGSNQLSKLSTSRPFVTSSTNSLIISGQMTTTTSISTNKLLAAEIDNVSIIENLNNSIEKDRDSSSSSVVYMSNSQLDKIQKHPLFSSFNANPAQTSSTAGCSSSNSNNNPIVTGSSLSPSSSSSSSTISSACSYSTTTSSSMSPASRLTRKNVSSLLRSGLNDSQITFNWLRDQQLEQYYENFVRAGYDLITIMKATPADLCAIGVSDPTHRHLLKQNMNLIDIGELEAKLNDYLHQVESIEELFKLIHLEQYLTAIRQHYKSLDDFLNTLAWEDLEEIGVNKLGHQKKLMFVCKKLKEIRSNQKDTTVMNVTPPVASTCVPIQISQNLTGENSATSSASLTMTKSLENVNDPLLIGKPTPPKRATLKSSQECLMVSFGNETTFKSAKGAHPPLPPRISSTSSSNKNYLNSLATLPRNKRHTRTSLEKPTPSMPIPDLARTQTLQRPTSASSTSSSSSSAISPKSSSSSPPHSTSPVNNKSELMPPTPPPMPLMSILTMSDQTTTQKSSRRMLPFNNTAKLHNLSPTTSLKPLLFTDRPQDNRLNSILNRHHSNLLASVANKMPPPAPIQTVSNKGSNVLNDIDIMLCDLNKQLDAMLDYEKAFK